MPSLFGAMGASQMQPAMMPAEMPMEAPKRKRGLFGGVADYLMGESGTPGINRIQTIGAGLKDIGGAINGGGSDNLMNLQLMAQKRQQEQAQQEWQAEQQKRQRQEWQAGDAQKQAIDTWVSMLPPDQQMLARVNPEAAQKMYLDAQKPKDPEYRTVGRSLVRLGADGVTPVYTAPSDSGSNGFGKAPSGYRYTPDGGLEAIPGGPAAIKNDANKRKADMVLSSLESSNANVMSAIQKARQLSKVGLTTGLGAMVTGKVGGTDTRNLARQLDVIKSNLGFDKLAEMRASSPTGGALGAVTERELDLLQSVVASLDQTQSDEQLRENLDRVEQHYSNMLRRVKSAYSEDFGDQQPTPAAATPPRPKGVPANAVFDPQTRRWKMP